MEKGPLKIWEHPQDDIRYTIGIDTATGVSNDYTVGCVITNTLPFEQVAVFRARLGIGQAAEEIYNLSCYYNNAFQVIETNGPGSGMQDAMLYTWRYPNCYKAEDRKDDDPDIGTKYGWNMTENAKYLLIRELQDALRQKEIIIRDTVTLEELCNFVFLEDKLKTGAASGFNDDSVVALMLAVHGARLNIQARKKASELDILTDDQRQHRGLLKTFMASIRDRRQQPLRIVRV